MAEVANVLWQVRMTGDRREQEVVAALADIARFLYTILLFVKPGNIC